MRLNNKGLSFVEIMVVVAIMSVTLLITGFGFNMVNGKPAEECAQKMVYSLQKSRTQAMGKYDAQYEISRNASNEVILTETVYDSVGAATPTVTTTVLGTRDVMVEYELDDGSVHSIDTTPLVVSFTRDTGAFRPVAGLNYCINIRVSKASTVRTIELAPFTGRIALQ